MTTYQYIDSQDFLTQVGQQHTDADGDDQDPTSQMQRCRDDLQALIIPRTETSQPPSDDAGGGNYQVKSSSPKAHRDHGKASNCKSIKPSSDQQYK